MTAVDSDWPGIKEARQQCVAKYVINSSISNTQRGREKIKRFGLQEMTGKRRRNKVLWGFKNKRRSCPQTDTRAGDTMRMVDQAMVTNERYSTPLDIHVIGLETFVVVFVCARLTLVLMDTTRKEKGNYSESLLPNQFHLDFIQLLSKSCRGFPIAPSNFIMTSSHGPVAAGPLCQPRN